MGQHGGQIGEALLERVYAAWTHLYGLVSFEVFGRLEGTIQARREYFDHQMGLMADLAGPPPDAQRDRAPRKASIVLPAARTAAACDQLSRDNLRALTGSAVHDLTLRYQHVAMRSEAPGPDARDVRRKCHKTRRTDGHD